MLSTLRYQYIQCYCPGKLDQTTFFCQSRLSVLPCYYPNLLLILVGPYLDYGKMQQNFGKYRITLHATEPLLSILLDRAYQLICLGRQHGQVTTSYQIYGSFSAYCITYYQGSKLTLARDKLKSPRASYFLA